MTALQKRNQWRASVKIIDKEITLGRTALKATEKSLAKVHWKVKQLFLLRRGSMITLYNSNNKDTSSRSKYRKKSHFKRRLSTHTKQAKD
jgi:hypothetical protein